MHMHMHMLMQVRALEALCTRAADASKRKSRDESRLAVWGGDESSTRRIHRRASTVSGQSSPASVSGQSFPASVFDEETHGGGALALVRAGGDASRPTTLHSETDMPPVTTSARCRGVNVDSYSPSVVAFVSNRSSARRASLGGMPPPQEPSSPPRATSCQASRSGWAVARQGSRRLSLSTLGTLGSLGSLGSLPTCTCTQGAAQFKAAARLYDAATSGCDEDTRLQPYVLPCVPRLQPYVPGATPS